MPAAGDDVMRPAAADDVMRPARMFDPLLVAEVPMLLLKAAAGLF